MRQLIFRDMHQSDDLVVTFDYCDAKGAVTHRVVSPIRFLGQDRLLALCLSREAPPPSSTWSAARTCGWRRRTSSRSSGCH